MVRDISDAFHRCPLQAAHIGAFTYVVSPLPSDMTILLCMDLVLPMGWVNSPDMFCAASETVADMANGYILDPTSDFVIYPPTVNTYSTTPAPTASSSLLQFTEVYMDDLLSATQGGQDAAITRLRANVTGPQGNLPLPPRRNEGLGQP